MCECDLYGRVCVFSRGVTFVIKTWYIFVVIGPVSVSRYTARLRAIGADLGTGH